MPSEVNTARSNQFRVRDSVGFKKWTKRRNIHFSESVIEGELHYEICPNDLAENYYYPCESGAWYQDGDDGSTLHMSTLAAELARFLEPGSVAILIEVMTMKLDIWPVAVAVSSDGQRRYIDLLTAIEEQAQEIGTVVSDW